MTVLRTPDERFTGLHGYDFAPHYTNVVGLRMHHVDEGPRSASPVLMLHGEPTWSYLYRHMIPLLANARLRAIAPDFIGFGRSDKPSDVRDYSYDGHVAWLNEWLHANDLRDITLVCQDWGSLIGLRVITDQPERFARVVVANGFLPTGDRRLPLAFKTWQAFARFTPVLPVTAIVRAGCARGLSKEARRGYAAPFPHDRFKAGARAFPRIVPGRPDDPAAPANRRAWEALSEWRKPLLTLFGAEDPIFRGLDRVLQKHIPGAAGQPHRVLAGAGHFIQEDAGVELAEAVISFVKDEPR
jgi:haloalkane dehalogenase